MGLEIVSLPPGASIQDRGRPGWQRFGVSPGGALDLLALAEGAALLGNPPDAAALELPGGGGRFRAVARLAVALSGAEVTARVNDVPVPARASMILEPGDELAIGRPLRGHVAYLHLAGGIDAPLVLGSRSAHLRAGLGWQAGAGDVLRPLAPQKLAPPRRLPPAPRLERRRIGLLWGPQAGIFPPAVREAFLAAEFTASAERDRMGMRLGSEAGPFHAEAALTIASDAVVAGDIQIPGDGRPAVLWAEHQPTGGYPRIATVISAHLPALAQMPPGTRLRFELVTLEVAAGARRAMLEEMAALPARLAPLVRAAEGISAAELLRYNLAGTVLPEVASPQE